MSTALPKITINATTAIPALKTAQSTLYIGCNPTNSNCFNGEFAEFRVWNVARSAADILANYKKPLVGNETGLVGYWKFDDAATATSAADSVTAAGHTAHNGTLDSQSGGAKPDLHHADSAGAARLSVAPLPRNQRLQFGPAGVEAIDFGFGGGDLGL
jgi:hypothetical protein